MIALISFHSLIWFELVDKTLQKDCNVHKIHRWKGTMTPYNIASVNAQGDFVAESWPHKLVRFEFFWLLYLKVSAINRHLADRSIIC